MKLLSACLALLCFSLPVLGQSEPRLSVELIPESTAIAAGKPFTVAVKMKHVEHGHSYWKNPGGPGQATKFEWTLPAGFTAAEAQWPAPKFGETSGIPGYVYEGEVVPLVSITPPAGLKSGVSISLDLLMKALVCTDTCKPEKVKGSTKVTVADAASAPDAATQALFTKARAALPVEPKGWTITADKKADQFIITLTPGSGANTKLSKAYFFSAPYPDQVTDSAKPQELKKDGDHWTLSVPPAEDMLAKTDTLEGLLVSEDGWLDGDANTKAFDVKLKIGEAAKASASTASAPTSSVASTTPTTENYSTLTLLFFALIGGLILNVMPCVFPVIGIKIMGFVEQAGENRRHVIMHGLAYTMGVLVCFWGLALFVIIAGKGWGAQLQSPLFVFVLCYFFMAFGLNMAGMFEFGTSAIGVGQGLQSKSGLGGSFFQGLLATLVATPCSAPFLAPALAWAVSLPPVMALLVFTVIGLGLALPYLVLSFAPGLVKLLPRPGAWMESFKQGMSFLLFGTAGYMLWVLTGMIEQWNVLMTILGLVLIALACWIYGRWFLPHKPVRTRSIALGFAVLALFSGLWIGWPSETKGHAAEGIADGSHLEWKAWSPELVKELRAAGKPVYIDFTALWCATCQFNKRLYKHADMMALIKSKGITLLKADYTNYDERIINTIRSEYHREAVPVNVLYVPGREQGIVLPSALTTGILSDALNQIK